VNKDQEYFLAWLAGFWEGEGSFTCSNKRGAEITIAQSFDRGFKVLHEISAALDSYGIKANLQEQPVRINTKRTGSGWIIRIARSRHIELFLKLIDPYLKFRKEEIKPKLELLKNKRKRPMWDNDEIKYLEDAYGKIPTKIISENLGRPIEGVRWKALSLNLQFKNASWRHRWSEKEKRLIIEHKETDIVLSRKIKRSPAAIATERWKLCGLDRIAQAHPELIDARQMELF